MPLAELGVTHVELMPVNAYSGEHGWGYDGVCWYAVHEPYGGPAALVRFVAAAHAAGLAVVLDVVYNHLGPSGNYLPDFGPYLTDVYRTPWGETVNVDGPGSDEVRAFVIGNALWWLTVMRVDGLRLDAVHGIVDTSAVDILQELTTAAAGRGALIAETDRQDPRTITEQAAGGQGLDAQWADDLHHAIHVAVTGERDGYYVDYTGLTDVAAAYTRGFVYDGRYSRYRQRHVGAPLGDLPGHRLVTCIQNHDQVGNRPFGDRLETLVEPALVRAAVVLLCASPTTPMLFMGEEYGERAPFQYFTSHPEPELAAAVRRGRREEFASFAAFAGEQIPDPQDPATLRRSTLAHALADSEHGKQRRALWTDVLAARRAQPALGDGRRDLVELLSVTADRLVLVRGGQVLLVANLACDRADVALPSGRWRVLLCSEDERYGGAGAGRLGGDTYGAPPRSATLLLSVAEH